MPAGVPAMVALANTTLSGSAATVTFSSISGSYRDLVLVTSTTCGAGVQIVGLRFNSDSGSNYSYVYAEGSGSASFSGSGTNSQIYLDPGSYGATTSSDRYNGITHILDYSATDKHKTAIIRADIASSGVAMTAGRWANTSAITTVTVVAGLNNFVAGSTFALYGVSSS
jgi:hypothetical protein